MVSKKKLTVFQQALLDTALEEFKDIPAEEDIDVTPSPKFTAWTEDLIRKSRRRSWRYINTAFRRAVLIAAILSVLVVTVAATPAIREKVISFFIQDHGTHYGFTFDPEQAATAPECIETIMGPTYIPEGFELVLYESAPAGVIYAYQNSAGEWLDFDQSPIPEHPEDDSWININAEDVTTQSKQIGDYWVFMTIGWGYYSLYWTDNSYFYSLGVPDSFSMDEVERIFLSIQPLPDAQFTVVP